MFSRHIFQRCVVLLVSGLLASTAMAVPDDNSTVDVVESEWEGEVILTIPIESPGIPGDANNDGTVNAADIVEVVNYIMGNPSEKFYEAFADANGDGVVNAADIVAIVNIIMGN